MECQGVWHWFCLNAKGAGIGNPKGSAIGFTSMPRGLSLISFLAYLITRLRAIVQSDCSVACNHAMGQYPKVVFRLLVCVQSCSAFGFWGFVEMVLTMVLTMKKLSLCNKNERRPRLLCNKDCDSMVGNRHKTTAQQMPSSKKQDRGDQPLFDQSDLYVVPEASIYEIFGGILSSMPSSSE